MENLPKNIIIPVDGSKNALKSFDYLDLIYDPKHNLDVSIFYVLPSLPSILIEESLTDRAIRGKKFAVEKKNLRIADELLNEAKTVFVKKGFDEERITTISQRKETSTARDICNWANRKRVDAVLLTRRGRTELETFFMGGVSSKLVNYCGECPLWIVEGGINSKKVLVCVDNSENALRAVDHAGFMLSGTDCKVTIFHTIRHLRRYVTEEVLEEAEELHQLWKSKASEQIAPNMEKAHKMLLDAGLTKDQITTKVVNGSRSAADYILKEARSNGYGTIVLGRHGQSMMREFVFGSVTSKILHHSSGLAVWIVQ